MKCSSGTASLDFWDSFGIEHAAKVEAESLFEAAAHGLHRLDMDSSFWTEEDVFDRMCITVEFHEEPTTHTVMVERLKGWIESRGRQPREEAKKGGAEEALIWDEAVSAFCNSILSPFRCLR